jgi:tetratricopeptide (TPR) repeat protein
MDEEAVRANKAALQAIAAGDLRGARGLLEGALARGHGALPLWLNLAVVRRQLQEYEGSFAALREALALDNRNFAALLMQATLLDRLGRAQEAATAYGIALALASSMVMTNAMMVTPLLAMVAHRDAPSNSSTSARVHRACVRKWSSHATTELTTMGMAPSMPQIPIAKFLRISRRVRRDKCCASSGRSTFPRRFLITMRPGSRATCSWVSAREPLPERLCCTTSPIRGTVTSTST